MIDTILQQHLFQTKGTRVAMPDEAYEHLLEALEQVVPPKPDEKKCAILLHDFFYWVSENELQTYDSWVDKFMAWAEGKTEPTWCKHISFTGTTWKCGDFYLNSVPPKYEWKFCPICTVSRPRV